MKSFSCWRLRASLVDFADGRLEEARRETVERHVGSCRDCAAAVLSLREVPSGLRRVAAAEREEALWANQRAAVMRAIGDSRTPKPRTRAPLPGRLAWARVAAVAAAVALIVLGSRWWTEPGAVVAPAREADFTTADPPLTSAAEIFSEDWLDTADTSLAMSDADDLGDLADFFADTAI